MQRLAWCTSCGTLVVTTYNCFATYMQHLVNACGFWLVELMPHYYGPSTIATLVMSSVHGVVVTQILDMSTSRLELIGALHEAITRL